MTYIYGYVNPVATFHSHAKNQRHFIKLDGLKGLNDKPSLEMAPSKKKSKSVSSLLTRPAIRRRRTSAFLSCSKTVYWITGFTTRTRAGPRPRKNAKGPPVCRRCAAVAKRPRRLCGTADVSSETASIPLTVCDVWITQTGLEMTVVAEPADFPPLLRADDMCTINKWANQRSTQQAWIRG